MEREGIYAARSAREIGADGEGKAGGSNAQKPPPGPESLLDMQSDNGNFQSSAGPESLLTEPARSPVPDSTLPARKPHPPAQISFPRSAERPDFDRNAALEERRDPTRQPDCDDGSRLRGRDEPRRQP